MEYKKQALELQKKPFLSFGWTPDYENIGIYYQRAANAFANSDMTESIECYQLATDNLLKAGIIFEAAKSQELLAKLLKKSTKFQEAVAAFDKAGELFSKLAQNDTASEMFSNAAQVAEQAKDLKISGALYTKAVDILVDNDKGILSHDMFKKATGFFLRTGSYKDAIELYKKQIVVLKNYKKQGGSKVQLQIIIIYAAHKEFEAASDYLNQCMSDLGNNSDTLALLGPSSGVELPQELSAAQSLLDGISANNDKAVQAVIQDNMMFLDVEVAKLCSKIKIVENTPTPVKVALKAPTAASSNGPAPVTYDVDEEEGFA